MAPSRLRGAESPTHSVIASTTGLAAALLRSVSRRLLRSAGIEVSFDREPAPSVRVILR